MKRSLFSDSPTHTFKDTHTRARVNARSLRTLSRICTLYTVTSSDWKIVNEQMVMGAIFCLVVISNGVYRDPWLRLRVWSIHYGRQLLPTDSGLELSDTVCTSSRCLLSTDRCNGCRVEAIASGVWCREVSLFPGIWWWCRCSKVSGSFIEFIDKGAKAEMIPRLIPPRKRKKQQLKRRSESWGWWGLQAASLLFQLSRKATLCSDGLMCLKISPLWAASEERKGFRSKPEQTDISAWYR